MHFAPFAWTVFCVFLFLILQNFVNVIYVINFSNKAIPIPVNFETPLVTIGKL